MNLETRIPPPLIAVISAGLVMVINALFPSLQLGFVPDYLANLIAMVLVVAAISIAILALGLFHQEGTTITPVQPGKTTALVTDGIYSITRNPMYLGLALLLLALILSARNLAGLFVLPLMIAYLTRYQIIPEERALEHLFADDYTAYKNKVRRWL